VHLLGWLIGTAEIWIALRFMGIPVSVNEAVVIESLVQAVRGAAFAIPGALGAQEAGLILLCGMFAIPPDQALALSLIKRAADLIVGVPGLIALQILEGGRLRARYSRANESRNRRWSLAEDDACFFIRHRGPQPNPEVHHGVLICLLASNHRLVETTCPGQ
jgi:Lysylphosphatidylglycerol synthase TM region